MLNQTLKKFYNLLIPSRKATRSLTNENSFQSPSVENNSIKQSSRIHYPAETKHNASYEKASAAEHDWWIN